MEGRDINVYYCQLTGRMFVLHQIILQLTETKGMTSQ